MENLRYMIETSMYTCTLRHCIYTHKYEMHMHTFSLLEYIHAYDKYFLMCVHDFPS